MSIDHRLLDLFVCPVCKGPLKAARTAASTTPLPIQGQLPQPNDASGNLLSLICSADRLAFPVRDGIPMMMESEARSLGADEA